MSIVLWCDALDSEVDVMDTLYVNTINISESKRDMLAAMQTNPATFYSCRRKYRKNIQEFTC